MSDGQPRHRPKYHPDDLNRRTGLHHEITQGLVYVHSRLNANTTKTLEASSFFYALIELMGDKGILTVEELDKRKRVVGKGLKDIREGIVCWNLGQPCLIAHNGDGYCCHMDCTTQFCAIWENRPVLCRAFDCRRDKRIWLDFENMRINPDVNRDDRLHRVAHQENDQETNP